LATALIGLMEKEMSDWVVDWAPIKRMGRTAEVANAVLFLASDEAGFVTGAELAIDGGSAFQ
jgi:NAD(P)-dependent dehydrogenase (short-subunit alcohol dehydrogenase family)